MNTSPNNKPVLISLRNVALCYKINYNLFNRKNKKKEVWALNDVSLDIHEGAKLGIIGRNGCGKSTLMRVIAGIIEPDKGEIIFSRRTRVQLLSLGVGLEQILTGRENAVLNGMLIGKSRKFMLECSERIKEFSGLGEFFEMPVSTYSSGMLSRLCFSVGIEADPEVLLIDEVLGVGDALFAEKSTKALNERFKSNRTMVLISHDPHTIARLCEQAVWIENGVTMASGAPDEVAEKYMEALHKPGNS